MPWVRLAGGLRGTVPLLLLTAPSLPQASLLRCVPLWALVINNFTFHYAFFILMSWLPTLYDARGADPTRLGSLKMVPYLIMGAPLSRARPHDVSCMR